MPDMAEPVRTLTFPCSFAHFGAELDSLTDLRGLLYALSSNLIARLLNRVRASIPLVDVLRILDNSAALNPFVPVLTISNGKVEKHLDPLPAWAAALVLDHPLPGPVAARKVDALA